MYPCFEMLDERKVKEQGANKDRICEKCRIKSLSRIFMGLKHNFNPNVSFMNFCACRLNQLFFESYNLNKPLGNVK